MENIKNIDMYYSKFDKFIELIPVIEQALECPQWIREKENIEDFMRDELNNAFEHLGEVKEAIDQVKVTKNFRKVNYIDRTILFIYSAVMDFVKTDKVNGTPITEKFVENIKGILNNKNTFITLTFLVKF